MSFSILIPARLASTRLPDKPLADIAGVPMVVRVAQRAALSRARQVVVAADDGRIVAACERHGVRALLTRTDHASGSDRLAEACELLGLDGAETVVNVQGDEPLIEPALIDACAALLDSACRLRDGHRGPSDRVGRRLPEPQRRQGRARSLPAAPCCSAARPLPWWRDGPAGGGLSGLAGVTALPDPPPLRHVGLYGYRAAFLRRFPTLPMAPLERIEALEQLRVLWHGERIAVHVTAAGAWRRRRHAGRSGARARPVRGLIRRVSATKGAGDNLHTQRAGQRRDTITTRSDDETDPFGAAWRRQGHASHVPLPEVRHPAGQHRRHAARRDQGRHAAGRWRPRK